MSAGAVRWGGIMVFVGIGFAVIFPFILVASVGLQGLQAGTSGLGGGAPKILSAVSNIVMTAIMIYAFLATKAYFNAFSYRRANIPIFIFVGLLIVWVILGLTINSASGLTALIESGNTATAGVIGIVILVLALVNFAVFILIAAFCIGFGRTGGGLWKAIGILYLIALIGILLSLLILGIGAALAAGGGSFRPPSAALAIGVVLIIVALLCYAAAIICHGIGLITAAGKMERMPSAADVFD